MSNAELHLKRLMEMTRAQLNKSMPPEQRKEYTEYAFKKFLPYSKWIMQTHVTYKKSSKPLHYDVTVRRCFSRVVVEIEALEQKLNRAGRKFIELITLSTEFKAELIKILSSDNIRASIVHLKMVIHQSEERLKRHFTCLSMYHQHIFLN
ncbi:hypothetical protein GQR58_020917 [Nymphon striatum]|nr:hypothetical protein GQR58_020917 [Nymphon striatum]